MIINIENYEQGATTGSATIQVLDKYDEFIMDLTVNFEFTTEEYETGDGYLTPIEDWLDVEITQTEYFNTDMQRFTPKREIQDHVESALINEIKDRL
jgi:hypothetical protein